MRALFLFFLLFFSSFFSLFLLFFFSVFFLFSLDDRDDSHGAFARAAFKKHANAASNADADFDFSCSTAAFARSPGSTANVGHRWKTFAVAPLD